MQKQHIALGIIIMLICSSLMISGCIQENSPIDQNNKPSSETLDQLLGKAQIIESVYYEINISEYLSGELIFYSDVTIWQETPYVKENVSQSHGGIILPEISYIKSPNGTYQYDAEENRYRNDYDPKVTLPYRTISEIADDLLNNQMLTSLGTETVDGKTTTVLQYSSDESGNTTTMKMWIWNDYGVPVKATETRMRNEMTLTWEYSYHSYTFTDIPDSTFDIS
jgi:outer membrane lipoprotein-sorting protein